MKTTATQFQRNDDHFPDLSAAVLERAKTFAGQGPFFVAETPTPLYTLYLEGFEDATARQTHTCHCCRRFLEQYGALVTIDERGRVSSVLWDETQVPAEYFPSVLRLREAVESAAVAGVHYDGNKTWGTPKTPDPKRGVTWEHFHVPALWKFADPLKSAFQRASEVREERGMLARGLADFARDAVVKAKALCEAEQLYRSEKVLGVATWLLELHDRLDGVRDHRVRDNLLWKAAASAPAGFCHVRSTMIGTLLEDLSDASKTVEDAKRSFASKMHPLQYQRMTSAPTAAQIEEAEKAIEKLRTARSLERRFARLEDLELVWKPLVREQAKPGGVFGHLKARVPESYDIGGATPMTWDKFSRTVLPTAERIEVNVPAHGNFIALVTAAVPDAPPLLQWDSEEKRNPVSWYVFHGGAHAAVFNLTHGWHDLTGITLLPPMWHGRNFPNEGQGAILVIEGARDIQHQQSGGFFVECLKSEYHPIKRTLEAYMMSARIEGKEEASAAGLDLRKGDQWRAHVRVTAGGISTGYMLDRWD